LRARWRILFHVPLAVELIARIQKRAVIALADQAIELLDGEALVEIDFFEFCSLCAKPTLRVAAGGSSRFEVELEGGHMVV
jgi:hypothetical protein